MSKKRGQVTAFIFVGILIFMILAFAIYGVGKIANIKLQEAAENQINDVLYNQNIIDYVDRCVRDVTKDSLVLIGKQGGYIYKEQGVDLPINPPFETIITENEIKENYTYLLFLDNEQFTSPNYPCKNIPTYGCGEDLEKVPYCKFIHKSSSDKFCVFESEILPELEVSFTGSENELERDLFLEEKLEGVTIKQELEDYITNRTHYCVNFTKLQKTFPLFEIKEGDISTTVTLGKEQISVIVNYPIEVSLFNRPIKTKTIEFNTIQKNRLGEIIIFLNRVLLRKETRDLTYDIESDGMREFENKFGAAGGLTLDFEKNLVPGADLIEIKDSIYTIYGSDYVFRFLRENANPALDYIPKTGAQGLDYDIITIATEENVEQKLLLAPVGRDINEDNLFYKYYGWMAEFNQTYRISESGEVGCVLNSDLNDCSQNYYFSEYFNTIKTEGIEINEWENSTEYLSYGKQNASIILNRERDLGPHNVTIVVSDEHGLSDWQIIRIFIDKELKAIFDPCNVYNYLDLTLTNFECIDGSIEDPYVLDASRSVGSLLGTLFIWSDDIEGWENIGIVNHYCSLLPGFLECGIDAGQTIKNYDILTIANSTNNFNTTGHHNITLSLLGYGQLDSVTHDVNVHQCLPFRADSPAFPYNTTNAFFSDHTCCNEDGWGVFNVFKTNKECYNDITYSWYGGFNNFMENLNINLEGYEHQTFGNYNDVPDYPQKNNIFKMEMSRNCDGTRGNICAGNIIFTKTSYEDCNDINFGTNERCSGPNANLKNAVFTIEQNVIQDTYCINYYGTTFEKEFDMTGATGVCNETDACVGNTLIYNWTCDGDGGCTKPKKIEDCNVYDGFGTDLSGEIFYYNYSCVANNDGSGLDAIEEEVSCKVINTIDLDTNQILCEGCAINGVVCDLTYFGTEPTGNCCGDDPDEFVKQTVDPKEVGCCLESQCWDGINCVSEGITKYFNGQQYVCKFSETYDEITWILKTVGTD